MRGELGMRRIEPRRLRQREALRREGREGREGEAVRSQDFSPSIFQDFSPYYKHCSFETYLIQH